MPQNGNKAQEVKEDLRAAARQARAAASQAADTIGREASSAVETLKQEGQGLVEAAQHRAEEAVEQGKAAGVEQAEGIARAVHRAASELEGSSPQLARIVHDAAGTIDGMTRSLRESSPGDMLRSVQDFARRNPLAFFGASVVAGFALARFARATSPRPSYEGQGYGYGGDEAGRPHHLYSGPSAGMSPAGSGGMTHGQTYGSTGGSMETGGSGMAPQSSAAGAPGWVESEDGAARPATLASASLGGAAAQKRPENKPFDPDLSAGSKS
jgi:hypothetical protein